MREFPKSVSFSATTCSAGVVRSNRALPVFTPLIRPTTHPWPKPARALSSIPRDCDRFPQALGDCIQSNYETGTVLARAGVVSGHDLTIEAAVAKLMFLFSQYDSIDEVKRLMETNLVGELTVPSEETVSI